MRGCPGTKLRTAPCCPTFVFASSSSSSSSEALLDLPTGCNSVRIGGPFSTLCAGGGESLVPPSPCKELLAGEVVAGEVELLAGVGEFAVPFVKSTELFRLCIYQALGPNRVSLSLSLSLSLSSLACRGAIRDME